MEATELTKIGRPSKRTDKLDDELVAWIAEGKTIRAFCREHEVDSSTIYNWMTQDATLSLRVARAREAGAMMLEDEIQEIADTPSGLADDVQHRKLQIYAREKKLVWSNPGRYGSKVQLGGAVGLPPVQLSDVERATRIKQLLDKADSNGTVKRLHVEVEDNDE